MCLPDNSQTTHYTMDLNAGLTQVLQDGTNTYLYGAGRIAQYSANGPEYYLGVRWGLDNVLLMLEWSDFQVFLPVLRR